MNKHTKTVVLPFVAIYFVCLVFVVYELSIGTINLLELAVVFAGWLGGFAFAFIYLEWIRYWHSKNEIQADHTKQ